MSFPTDMDGACELDRQDNLAGYREAFVIEDPELIYLDGNSLGRLPKQTKMLLHHIIEKQWGERLIRSWHQNWLTYPEKIGEKIAKLIGAKRNEVIVADSTSVNLFKLILAALQINPSRRKIITDDMNFPSDLYMMRAALRCSNQDYDLKVIPSPDGISMPFKYISKEIDHETALVSFSHTVFKSAFVYNMNEMTQAAHNAGALILWDVSHSVGAMPLGLRDANVDMAVGCTYKYLNGGPGAPAFLYVREDLQQKLHNPIPGWFGHWDQFGFDPEYQPATSIRKFLTGTPPILSLAAMEKGIDLLIEAGMDRLREKSIRQTEYLIHLWQEFLEPLGFRLNSPTEPSQRGSHISFGHNEGSRINRALIEEANVIPDFRLPDNIRFGIAPLYTSFKDIYEAVTRTKNIVEKRLYKNYSFASFQPG